jgi:hypothetical protein
LYEYLEFVPLKAGDAVAFDNRTIHAAPPNLTRTNRTAVAIGMTPREAPLYHYYLLPAGDLPGPRRIAKFKVDQQFFHRYSVALLRKLYEKGESPQYEIESILGGEFHSFPRAEIQRLCELMKLEKNGRRLEPAPLVEKFSTIAAWRHLASRLWERLRAAKDVT